MFGRATITLGIGPHSSSCLILAESYTSRWWHLSTTEKLPPNIWYLKQGVQDVSFCSKGLPFFAVTTSSAGYSTTEPLRTTAAQDTWPSSHSINSIKALRPTTVINHWTSSFPDLPTHDRMMLHSLCSLSHISTQDSMTQRGILLFYYTV